MKSDESVVIEALDRFDRGRRDNDGGGKMPPVDHEKRITTLEAVIPTLATTTGLASVEAKLGHVDREVSNLKWWLMGSVVTILLTSVGTVIGTGIGIQQMTVATFQAAAQQPQQAQQPTIIVVPQAQAASR